MSFRQFDESDASRFWEHGYCDPIDLFDERTSRRLAARLKSDTSTPAVWPKGCAVSSRLYYEIACEPRILTRLQSLLNKPVMLWGASLILRVPGQRHLWHTDIETANSDGRALSVWIGLEGTGRGSGLSLVPGSHRFGQSVQSMAATNGVAGKSVNNELIEAWANTLAPGTKLDRPDIRNGQAIIFDGRLWHGTANQNRLLARRALLLQYATPDLPIRCPNPNYAAWPFQTLNHPKPPSIMVVGSGTNAMNQLVPPPANTGHWPGSHLSTILHPLPDPMPPDTKTGWRSHFVFRGQTTQVPDIGCHVSVLSPQTTPHSPHQHIEEELLIMLSGRATLNLVDDATGEIINQTLNERECAYYPRRGMRHTLTNNHTEPATYLMFKWRADLTEKAGKKLKLQIFSLTDAFQKLAGRKSLFRSERLLEGETEYLKTLHAHVSEVDPGGGYAEHVDAHDVAILLLEGTVETLNQTVCSPCLIYYAGGQQHGLKNNGKTTARYLVFEFHGERNSGLLPTRYDAPAVKAWIKQSAKRVAMRSPLLEGLIRKLASLVRRR